MQASSSKTPSKKPRAFAKCKQLSSAEKEKLFDLYIRPNLASIKSLTKRYTDDYHDVEENYNHCLAQLFNYIGSYNAEQKLDTWIHICVKRACFRENLRRKEEDSHWTDIEMCSQDDLYQNGSSMITEASFGTLIDNVSDVVYKALMQIPPQRLSPFLQYAQGYGIRDITAAEWKLGHLERRSEDVVKSRIYWAQHHLQFILRKYGYRRKNQQSTGNDQ